MKLTRLIFAGIALLMLVIAGCSPDDPTMPDYDVEQPEGTAALAHYVAVGNSLTAGYMDRGLSVVGQLSSYPAQIATRLGYDPTPGAANWFAQPLIDLPGVGTSTPSEPSLVAGVLHWNGTGITVLDETPLADLQSTLLLASSFPTPYPNLGIPGATILDVTNALDSSTSQSPGNSYFDIVLRNPTFGDVVQLDQVIAQGPTLVTLWIGGNDYLGGATSGAPVIGVNLTPGSAYAAMLEAIVVDLLDGVHARFGYQPHLVVANLPSIQSTPFFMPKVVFDAVVGVQGFPTVEDDVEIVLFPTLGEVLGGWTDPLLEDWTLTADEVAAVDGVVNAYNDAIDDLAGTYDFTVADMNGLLAGLPASDRTHFQLLLGQGLSVPEAAAATVFSLDGIHPNSRGYSLVANEFIEAINAELGLSGSAALAPVAEAMWDPTYAAYGLAF